MWGADERESLAVWADMLQAKGEALGELAAASLSLDALEQAEAHARQVRAPAPHVDRLAPLRDRIEQLRAEPLWPELPTLKHGDPEIDQQWSHGMLTALRVVEREPLSRPQQRELLERLRGVLRHPCARFLRYLRVDVRTRDWAQPHAEVLELLGEPGVVAQPWTLVLGLAPHDQRRHVSPTRLGYDGELHQAALAPERGLRTAYVYGARVDLPWVRGDKGTRLAALDRVLGSDDPTLLARALWDTSVRVRCRAIDRLPLLGERAAPFVADLLLVDRGEFEWLTRVREVLASVAQNETVVEAIAREFTIDQPRCAAWLAASELGVARLAGPRLELMRQDARPCHPAGRRELVAAARKLEHRRRNLEFVRAFDQRTPSSQPLIKRLRRWLSPS